MFVHDSFLPFVQALYSKLGLTKSEANFFASPLSIYSALSLVLPGCASQCRTEIVKTLKLNAQEELHSLSKVIGNELQSISEGDEKQTLVQANGIFIQNNFNILADYSKVLTEFYKTETHKLNFSKNPEASRTVINKWIEDNTKEKIKELLKAGTITNLTRLVLANAVYFKGIWQMPFDQARTDNNAVFHTLSNGDVVTSMMYKKAYYKIADFVNLEVRVIRIPFECHEMWVVLPEHEKGLPDVLKRFNDNPDWFKEMFTSDQYFSEEVILRMPKFTLGGESMQLKEALGNMGLRSIFDVARADLSGITGDKSLTVSDVYHQAVIEVDEQGAEAAAATAIPMMMRCMPMPPPEFVVDHPFVFFIVTQTGFPVFMGHVVEPKVKK